MSLNIEVLIFRKSFRMSKSSEPPEVGGVLRPGKKDLQRSLPQTDEQYETTDSQVCLQNRVPLYVGMQQIPAKPPSTSASGDKASSMCTERKPPSGVRDSSAANPRQRR